MLMLLPAANIAVPSSGKRLAYKIAAHLRASHAWLTNLPLMVLTEHSCNVKVCK